jgi:hypothetical protein
MPLNGAHVHIPFIEHCLKRMLEVLHSPLTDSIQADRGTIGIIYYSGDAIPPPASPSFPPVSSPASLSPFSPTPFLLIPY